MQLVPGGLAEGVPEDKTPPPAPIHRDNRPNRVAWDFVIEN